MRLILERMERDWGKDFHLEMWAPSIAANQDARRAVAAYLRLAASPGAAVTTIQLTCEIDVRHVLPVIRVPTLVVHRVGDRVTRIEQGRYLAEHIAGAKLIELPGDDHMPSVGGEAIIDEIEEFLTGIRPADTDRVWRRSSSPTSSARRSGRWRSVIAVGASCSSSITAWPAASSAASGAARSTRPATGSSRRSTAPPAQSGVPAGSATRSARSASRCAAGSTPANAKWSATRSRHRGPHRRPRGGGGSGRGLRVQHRQGRRGWLRDRLQGSRNARAQGVAGRLAALRGGRRRVIVLFWLPELHPGITQEVAPNESQRAPKAATSETLVARSPRIAF
jgi:hypothetical protein